MPLDEVGRRYAENLYNNSRDEVLEWQRGELSRIRAEYTRKGSIRSGIHVSAQGNVLLEMIRKLGEARAASLLKAYEKSGLPFDDAAHDEIRAQVMDFVINSSTAPYGLLGRSHARRSAGRSHRILKRQLRMRLSTELTESWLACLATFR